MGKLNHRPLENLSWRRALRVATSSNLVLGLVLAALSWPYNAAALRPEWGIDAGWSAALEMIAQQRLPYGTHVVFAYGPLGFLAVWPVYFTVPAIFGFLFQLALYTVVFAALVWSLRQVLPVAMAVVVAFVAGTISIVIVAPLWDGEPEKALALALVGCVYAMSRPAGAPAPRHLWIGLGACLGMFGLVKASVGVGIATVLVITIAFLPSGRRRALALVAPSALITFLVGWFATGNGFDNMVAFVRGTVAIISGYAAAVSVDDPNRWYTYWWAVAVMAIVAALAVARCWHLPRRAQAGIGLATLFVIWELFREGFVRHDLYHDPIFFAAAPLVAAAFVPPRRTLAWGSAFTVGVLATSLVAGGLSWFPSELTRPASGVPGFVNEVSTLVVPGNRSAQIDTDRAALQALYEVPYSMLARMDGHTVYVDPWEETVVWAYPGLRFDPLPTVQPYNTYTTALDRQDVSYLSSANAPDYILREPPAAFDHRDPAFEPPATQIAMECRYRQVEANASWQLVARARNRCGRLRSLGTASLGLDEWVRVPTARPGEAVVATFQLPLSPWWWIQNEIFKPPSAYVIVNGGSNVYRFVTGTASSLHLLRPASNLGYDPEFTPQTVSELLFTISGEGLSTSGVVVHFYALPMTSLARH
jgi:hypothetical protein